MTDLELKRALFEDLLKQKKERFNRLKKTQRERLGEINKNGTEHNLLESRKENEMQEVRLEYDVLEEIENNIKKLENIASIPVRTDVSSLALVRTDKESFLVCLPADELSANNEHFIGVSVKSPIYEQMHGKKAGDSFTYNNKHYTITSIA